MLEEKLTGRVARFADRREDWSVFGFETARDPRYARAQRRYLGARSQGSARRHPGDGLHDVDTNHARGKSHADPLSRNRGGLLHPGRRMPRALLGGRGELRYSAWPLGSRRIAAVPEPRDLQRRTRRLPRPDIARQAPTITSAICRPRIAGAASGPGARRADGCYRLRMMGAVC